MGNITAYIGSEKVPAITSDIAIKNQAITVSGNQVTAYIVADNYPKLRQGQVYAKILPLDKHPFLDMSLEIPFIFIEEDEDNKPYYKIRIIIQPPLSPNWRKTSIVIWGYNTPEKPKQWSYDYIQPTSGNSFIPEKIEDVILPNGEKSYHFNLNNILPGEKVTISWDLFDGLDTHVVDDLENAYEYWQAPTITGGEIKSINGEYEDEDLSFVIYIGDQEVTCKPSDYSKWEIGDWVFVVRGYNIILPILVDNKGTQSDSVLVDYKIDEMPRLLTTKFYSAEITDLDKKNNIGSVELANNQGVLNEIPIFYHVPIEPGGDVSIDDGGQAFKVGDPVLVHHAFDSQGTDIFSIVGFLDGLHEPERWIEYWAGNWTKWITIDYENNYMYIMDATMHGIRRLNLNSGQLDAYWQPKDENGNTVIKWTGQYYEYHAVEFNHLTGELIFQARYIYSNNEPGDGRLYKGTFGQTEPVTRLWDGDFIPHVCRETNRFYGYKPHDGVIFNHSLTDFYGDYETTYRHPWDPQIPIPGNCDFFVHDCNDGAFYFYEFIGENTKSHIFRWYWCLESIDDWQLEDYIWCIGFDVSPINHRFYFETDETPADEINFREWQGSQQSLKLPKASGMKKLIHDDNYFWFATGVYVVQTTLEYLEGFQE